MAWEESDSTTSRRGRSTTAALVAVALAAAGIAITVAGSPPPVPPEPDDAPTLTIEELDEALGTIDADGAPALPDEESANRPAPAPPPYRFAPPDETLEAARLPETTDLTLWAFDDGGRRLHLVDLETGIVSVGHSSAEAESLRLQPVWASGLMVVGVLPQRDHDGALYGWTGGLEQRPRLLAEHDRVIGVDGSDVWVLRRYSAEHTKHGTVLARVAPTLGRTDRVTEFTLPERTWPVGIAAGHIVLASAEGVLAYDPESGTNRVLGDGQAIAAAGDHAVSILCQDDRTCEVRSEPVAGDGPRRVVSLGRRLGRRADDLASSVYGGSLVSPDGRHLVLMLSWNPPSHPLRVMDLDDGSWVDVPDVPSAMTSATRFPPVWSPDGTWLFAPSVHGGVTAWHTATRQAHHLPFMDATPEALAVR